MTQLGFEEVSQQFIDEYNSTAILYRHKKTGAEVMSVSNDDENKVFGVVFRTPPYVVFSRHLSCCCLGFPVLKFERLGSSLREVFVRRTKGNLRSDRKQ